MNMSHSEKTRFGFPILGGLIWAFGLMAVGALVLSLTLAFTGQKESSLPSAAIVVHLLAAFIGGAAAGKRSGSKGWYTGGATGLLYALLLYLIGFLGFDRSFHLSALLAAAVAFAVGAVGGMIGVNLRK
ncbi:TIGR04086 family membrane protein [Gorillibacterium timonense]|uniref:TIGR04086 family membrane protein n=1 Tax=Gorillibacterium timonense TaxID=1689269 RepID=UPI00071CB0B0|nr:TIGR04086 family membrane protein [Gorillibacterium timonense]